MLSRSPRPCGDCFSCLALCGSLPNPAHRADRAGIRQSGQSHGAQRLFYPASAACVHGRCRRVRVKPVRLGVPDRLSESARLPGSHRGCLGCKHGCGICNRFLGRRDGGSLDERLCGRDARCGPAARAGRALAQARNGDLCSGGHCTQHVGAGRGDDRQISGRPRTAALDHRILDNGQFLERHRRKGACDTADPAGRSTRAVPAAPADHPPFAGRG